MKPTIPSPYKKTKILSTFRPNTRHYRILEQLCKQARVPVAELNKQCSVGNVSDIALKHNPTLRKFGLAIGCHRAPVCYMNQFHQPTAMHEWSLCKLTPAEQKLPTKGDDRPEVSDPLFKKRQKLVVELLREGWLLNDALSKTRDEDFVKRKA